MLEVALISEVRLASICGPTRFVTRNSNCFAQYVNLTDKMKEATSSALILHAYMSDFRPTEVGLFTKLE